MSNANETNASHPDKHPEDGRKYLGQGHKDIGDDFTALKSVLGISDLVGVGRLKNSLAALKALFVQ